MENMDQLVAVEEEVFGLSDIYIAVVKGELELITAYILW